MGRGRPKASTIVAQDNALGGVGAFDSRPERALQGKRFGVPFQGEFDSRPHVPRALPSATMDQPFRLDLPEMWVMTRRMNAGPGKYLEFPSRAPDTG